MEKKRMEAKKTRKPPARLHLVPQGTKTLAEVQSKRTALGGWTMVQLAEWGVPWPPPHGWKKRLCGY